MQACTCCVVHPTPHTVGTCPPAARSPALPHISLQATPLTARTRAISRCERMIWESGSFRESLGVHMCDPPALPSCAGAVWEAGRTSKARAPPPQHRAACMLHAHAHSAPPPATILLGTAGMPVMRWPSQSTPRRALFCYCVLSFLRGKRHDSGTYLPSVGPC